MYENIVESLETDLDKLNTKLEEMDLKINDLEKIAMNAPIWKKRMDRKWLLGGIGITAMTISLSYIAEASNIDANVLEQLKNIEVLKSTSFGVGFSILADLVMLHTRSSLRKQYHEEEDLKEAEQENQDLKNGTILYKTYFGWSKK